MFRWVVIGFRSSASYSKVSELSQRACTRGWTCAPSAAQARSKPKNSGPGEMRASRREGFFRSLLVRAEPEVRG